MISLLMLISRASNLIVSWNWKILVSHFHDIVIVVADGILLAHFNGYILCLHYVCGIY